MAVNLVLFIVTSWSAVCQGLCKKRKRLKMNEKNGKKQVNWEDSENWAQVRKEIAQTCSRLLLNSQLAHYWKSN